MLSLQKACITALDSKLKHTPLSCYHQCHHFSNIISCYSKATSSCSNTISRHIPGQETNTSTTWIPFRCTTTDKNLISSRQLEKACFTSVRCVLIPMMPKNKRICKSYILPHLVPFILTTHSFVKVVIFCLNLLRFGLSPSQITQFLACQSSTITLNAQLYHTSFIASLFPLAKLRISSNFVGITE